MGDFRIGIAQRMIAASDWGYKAARALCLCLLKPRDLIRLNQLLHSRPAYTKGAYDEQYAASGLTETEDAFVQRYLMPQAELLVLGAGGGRESLALAKMGFRVTGVDFVEETLEAARTHARRENLRINFISQEASRLTLADTPVFDAVFFPAALYSLIPSAQLRLQTLQAASRYLKPGAVLFLSFFLQGSQHPSKGDRLKKLLALITWGNRRIEPGDRLEGDGEFRHYFTAQTLTKELESSGFTIIELAASDLPQGSAVIRPR